MIHISKIVDLQKTKIEAESIDNSRIDEKTAQIVNWLFRELRGIFPAFKQAWPTDEEFLSAKRNWVKAFLENGIHDINQLNYGLKKCRKSGNDFAPSVGKFIDWCTPTHEDTGLPDFEQAYHLSILINRQFSDYKPECQKTYTVIRHAIDTIGSQTYREMKIDQARKSFEYHYNMSCKQFLNGNIKEISLAIATKPEEHSSDRAKSDLARMHALKALKKYGIELKTKNNV